MTITVTVRLQCKSQPFGFVVARFHRHFIRYAMQYFFPASKLTASFSKTAYLKIAKFLSVNITHFIFIKIPIKIVKKWATLFYDGVQKFKKKEKIKLAESCIIEVTGSNYFLSTYLHFTPHVQFVWPIKYQCCPHIETSQLICIAN